MDFDMNLSLEERRAEISETVKAFDLWDLRGAEFRRLLRFAHAEGLLAGLLRDNGILCSPAMIWGIRNRSASGT
jgi:hypothetical protein